MLPQLGSRAYHTIVKLAGFLGNSKAQKWVDGRRKVPDQLRKIQRERKPGQPLIWMHAASLGEFEQGMPVLEFIKKEQPAAYLVLSFFSPSGYEARKHYTTADTILYLAEDRPDTAKEWVAGLQPNLAIFIKYEFWPHHLRALKNAAIPTVLIAGSFRENQPFFKTYGGSWRQLLNYFDKLIVQTDEDAELLRRLDLPKTEVLIGGDPRIDRVLQLAATPFEDQLLSNFAAKHKCLLAGSVWQPDIDALQVLMEHLPADWRLILAPHQLDEHELVSWAKTFKAIRYTQTSPEEIKHTQASVLLLDTIGILSRSYRYGTLAYIGGGFGSGLHNTLEPMAYGLPVIFGPKYHKFPEAVTAVASGGAFSIGSGNALCNIFYQLNDEHHLEVARTSIREYTEQASGATRKTFAALLPFFAKF